jgi:hypothetical protein
LKTYFEQGDRPTEGQFCDFIDSTINGMEDEITVDPATKFVKIGQHVAVADMAAQGPKQQLEVDGAIRIGNTTGNHNGSIRWTGNDFEGRTGDVWKSLTASGIFIPAPRLRIFRINSRDVLQAAWDGADDLRFLSQSPRFYLYRYKSRNTYQRRENPKHWAHTDHQQVNPQHPNTNRSTEFLVPNSAGMYNSLDFRPESWFSSPVNRTPRPRGQGRFITNVETENGNRRFEYFRLRIVLQVGGTKVFGPFSETFSVGYRKLNNGSYRLVMEITTSARLGKASGGGGAARQAVTGRVSRAVEAAPAITKKEMRSAILFNNEVLEVMKSLDQTERQNLLRHDTQLVNTFAGQPEVLRTLAAIKPQK